VREYYFLTGLEDSPYDLTMADALHLGATGALPTYVYLTSPVIAEQTTRNQSAATEPEADHIGNASFWRESRSINFKFVKVPKPALIGLEGTAGRVALEHGHIDQHADGRAPVSIPFKDPHQWPHAPLFVKFLNEPPQISRDDLLCFADDLEKLADKGRIKRRADDTSAATSGQPDADRQHYPRHLEALTIAWRKFWKNADPTDRTACPKKPDVVAWLIAQGFSAKNADAGATIIKPKWAIDKGW